MKIFQHSKKNCRQKIHANTKKKHIFMIKFQYDRLWKKNWHLRTSNLLIHYLLVYQKGFQRHIRFFFLNLFTTFRQNEERIRTHTQEKKQLQNPLKSLALWIDENKKIKVTWWRLKALCLILRALEEKKLSILNFYVQGEVKSIGIIGGCFYFFYVSYKLYGCVFSVLFTRFLFLKG